MRFAVWTIGQVSGRPGFEVSVSGLLGLNCQSCGVAFDLAVVDSASIIHVARDAAELANWEDETFESIGATEKPRRSNW